MATQTKYSRSHLTQQQITLLSIVYKYRFVSRQLLAVSLGINPQNGLHERLQTLVTRGYLARRYDKRLKLIGTPAAYYLAASGMRLLQKLPEFDFIIDAVIKSSYKDGTVGQAFINHTLDIYKVSNALQSSYPGLKVFTRRDTSRYDYFPDPPPELFLSMSTDDPKQPLRFFLDIIPENMPRPAIEYKLASCYTFFEDGGWEVTGSELPTLLYVAENAKTERRLQRVIASQFKRSDGGDVNCLITSLQALQSANNTNIWSSGDEPEILIGLRIS